MAENRPVSAKSFAPLTRGTRGQRWRRDQGLVQSDGTFEFYLPPGQNFIYAMRAKDGDLRVDVPEEGPIDVEIAVK